MCPTRCGQLSPFRVAARLLDRSALAGLVGSVPLGLCLIHCRTFCPVGSDVPHGCALDARSSTGLHSALASVDGVRPDGRVQPSTSRAALGRHTASRLASAQAGIVTRRQLYRADVPRWLVRRELAVGRWKRTGRQSLVLHNGPLLAESRRWVAVLEAGRRAAIDGVTALQHAGVRGLDDDTVHVLTPKGSAPPRLPGVRMHESRRWREEDVIEDSGIRRVTPAVAAVHAALWARTEREATFLLALAVQQRVATPRELQRAIDVVRRHRLRKAMLRVVDELAGGVRSLGELDVGLAMRARGLPEPDRQVLRRRPSGRDYLDADFDDVEVTLEIDGWQHEEPEQRLNDTLRDLASSTAGRTVVRLPLVAWRWDEAAVLDALEALFRSRGWLPTPRAA